MISGVHTILYSKNPEADREFFLNVLGLTHVDVGHGWLIFGLPPTELAVHPADEASHELYLMCHDVAEFVSKMESHGIQCSEIQNRGWGLMTEIALPSGTKLGVYQPRHARPEAMK